MALDWTVENADLADAAAPDETFSTDGTFTRSCTADERRWHDRPGLGHGSSGTRPRPTCRPLWTATDRRLLLRARSSVTISSSDATSGLAFHRVPRRRRAVDGLLGSGLGHAVTASHTVDYRATDNAGNVGSGSTTFTVDTTAPMSNAVLSGTLNLGWWRNPTVTITAHGRRAAPASRRSSTASTAARWITYTGAVHGDR